MKAASYLFRATLCLVCVSAVSCGGDSGRIDFGSVPPSEAWSPEWRPISSLELEYPSPPASFSTDREREINAFLNESVRISPETLIAVQDLVLVTTDLQGRFGAVRYELKPIRADAARSSGGLYELRIRQEGLDAIADYSLELDHRFRLHDLQARVTPLRDAEGLTVMQSIARWEPASGGYRIASEVGEVVVNADEPKIPEEALGLLPLLCPRTAMSGRFSTISTGYKGIYPVDMEIRPAARTSDTSLVRIMSRSPLGREWSMVVKHGPSARFVHGQDSIGGRIYPGAMSDWDRVSGLVATVIRERAGELIFDGSVLYSSFRPDGSHIGPRGSVPVQESASQSWMSIVCSDLDLTVLSPGRDPGELLKMINKPYQGASPVARGLLNPNEIRLSVGLDLMPMGKNVADAGDALVASLIQKGMEFRCHTKSLQVNGQAACRIDIMQDVQLRIRGGGASKAQQYHAFLLVEHEGALLQLHLTTGSDWKSLDSKIEALFRSVRFRRPSAGDMLGDPRDIRASGE